MENLISVIVPIYKVEPYLRKCVDSIINQTYENLEIILVDDGSPDNCGAICDEYAQKDNRIRVIHKMNGGLSDARNAGLDIMKGRYVSFVDSDDWIETKMYEKLFYLMKKFDADIAFGGVTDDLLKNGKVISVKTSNYGNDPLVETAEEAMRRYFHGSWAAWDKLYKAELFSKIRYPLGEINEDEAIVLQILAQCKKVCYTNEIFYHYLKRADGSSITTSSFSKKKLDWVKHCAVNYKFVCERYPNLILDAATRYRNSILWALTEIALSNDCYKKEMEELKMLLKRNLNVFRRAHFQYKQDKVRMYILVYFPFPFYRNIIRMKRGT